MAACALRLFSKVLLQIPTQAAIITLTLIVISDFLIFSDVILLLLFSLLSGLLLVYFKLFCLIAKKFPNLLPFFLKLCVRDAFTFLSVLDFSCRTSYSQITDFFLLCFTFLGILNCCFNLLVPLVYSLYITMWILQVHNVMWFLKDTKSKIIFRFVHFIVLIL